MVVNNLVSRRKKRQKLPYSVPKKERNLPKRVPTPVEISIGENKLLNCILGTPIQTESVVQYVQLDEKDIEYLSVSKLFKRTAKTCNIDKIERIENKFLVAALLLKEQQLQERNGVTLKHRKLFHATKEKYVDNICHHNFDWRKNKGHWYGKGVYFTPRANIATKYADTRAKHQVMLLVVVLVGKSCRGKKNTLVPPDGFDTTQKVDGTEIVKYDDNEFYPMYKITYHHTKRKPNRFIKKAKTE